MTCLCRRPSTSARALRLRSGAVLGRLWNTQPRNAPLGAATAPLRAVLSARRLLHSHGRASEVRPHDDVDEEVRAEVELEDGQGAADLRRCASREKRRAEERCATIKTVSVILHVQASCAMMLLAGAPLNGRWGRSRSCAGMRSAFAGRPRAARAPLFGQQRRSRGPLGRHPSAPFPLLGHRSARPSAARALLRCHSLAGAPLGRR